MEDELWKEVYAIVADLGKEYSFKKLQHSTRTIVLTYLWAVLHDRPVCWACRPEHWPSNQHHIARPSPSCMSRRLRAPPARELLNRVESHLRRRFPPTVCKWIDAKPLPIGGASRDRDARYGRAAGCMAKGYKLYLICTSRHCVEAWTVLPINVNEKRAARQLILRTWGEGYLIGDNQYDSNPLYKLAAEHGHQLLAPRRRNTALGHTRHSPQRLRALELLGKPFGQVLLGSRCGVERFFGHLTSFGGGLGPLPNWVRRLDRVRLWVQSKLIFNAIRLLKIKDLRR